MNTSTWRIIQFIAALVLAIGFGWLAFSGQDWEELSLAFAHTRWGYVGLALVLTFLGHWARALRWRLLLAGACERVSARDALLSLLNGYFVNLGVPRLGEVTRCGVLNRLSGAPVLSIAGTVVAERAVDVVVLLLIAGTFFMSAGEETMSMVRRIFPDPSEWASDKNRILLLIVAGVIVIAGLLVLYRLAKKGKKEGGPSLGRWSRQLWQGLLSALRLRQRGGFLVLTVAIWISYFSAPLLSLYALGLARDHVLQVAFAAFLFGSLARTVPLPAGSAGAYHYLVASALMVWGYTNGEGLSLATLNHGVQTAFYLVAGLISWAALVWIFRRRLNASQTSA